MSKAKPQDKSYLVAFRLSSNALERAIYEALVKRAAAAGVSPALHAKTILMAELKDEAKVKT